MPRFEHAVDIARPPAEVFPWLFDADKVPRWTSSLESYERVGNGPLTVGSRFRQTLDIKGRRITVDLEVTRVDAPNAAETRFSEHGFDVTNAYALADAPAGTRLTQTVDAGFGSFSARLLAPIVEPYLREKLERDLAALRDLLG
jgi:carbon monoxide dehydrogenase subunit G